MVHDSAKRLLDFFEVENNRDWETYEKFLAPDVEWTAYGPPRRSVVKGRDEYVKTMKKAYKNIKGRFRVLNIAYNSKKNLVMAELELDSRKSVDVFEFRNGLIWREREYYDDVTWVKHLA